MRVVLDTNVLVSGIFWSGPPREILLRWQAGAFDLLISPPILTEYQEVISELSQKHKPLIDVRSLIDLITVNSLLIQSSVGPTPFCEDPDDVMFLQAAIAGKARFLVSGDRDLLKVGHYPRGQVVTARTFVGGLRQ